MIEGGNTRRVAVVYHFFPHYRAPVLRELAQSSRFEFTFWGDKTEYDGIVPYQGDDRVTINNLRMKQKGRLIFLRGYLPMLRDKNTLAVIVLGNPNIVDSWIMALGARLAGKKVLFWAHGWLKKEGFVKTLFRNIYFGTADSVLVYADRARELAERSGFPAERVVPIYNSLDWNVACSEYENLRLKDRNILRQELGIESGVSTLICTARLTPQCKFDLLLEAMSILESRSIKTQLILVGDGPERASLAAMVERLNLSVKFKGALYDETELAKLIFVSDLTVSPGKVGLTAMHSLYYGTAVITHGNLDGQMPEVEAVTSGSTGEFFADGDAADLADVIASSLRYFDQGVEARDARRMAISTRYTPLAQRQLIEGAVASVLAVE